MKHLLTPFFKIPANLKTRHIFKDNFSFLKYVFFSFIVEYKFIRILHSKNYLIKFRLKECLKKFTYARLDKHDLDCLKYVFLDKYHLPYENISEKWWIIDLWANIGYTALHLHYLYPKKNIIAVEMSPENYKLLQLNTLEISNIYTINAAIWHEETSIFFDSTADNDAFSAKSEPSFDTKSSTSTAITMQNIISKYAIENISFVKIDIEGAEYNLLKIWSTDRLDKAKSINIEIHDEHYLDYKNIFKEKWFFIHSNKHRSSILATKNSIVN